MQLSRVLRSSQRAAVDLSRLSQSLSLHPAVSTTLSQFLSSNSQASIALANAQASVPEVNLAEYRSLIKNTAAVESVEKALKAFKPRQTEKGKMLAIIETFEKTALERARTTANTVKGELAELNSAISDLNSTRPVEDLQERDVLLADPTIEETTDLFAKNSVWNVKQHDDIFGEPQAQ